MCGTRLTYLGVTTNEGHGQHTHFHDCTVSSSVSGVKGQEDEEYLYHVLATSLQMSGRVSSSPQMSLGHLTLAHPPPNLLSEPALLCCSEEEQALVS